MDFFIALWAWWFFCRIFMTQTGQLLIAACEEDWKLLLARFSFSSLFTAILYSFLFKKVISFNSSGKKH